MLGERHALVSLVFYHARVSFFYHCPYILVVFPLLTFLLHVHHVFYLFSASSCRLVGFLPAQVAGSFLDPLSDKVFVACLSVALASTSVTIASAAAVATTAAGVAAVGTAGAVGAVGAVGVAAGVASSVAILNPWIVGAVVVRDLALVLGVAVYRYVALPHAQRTLRGYFSISDLPTHQVCMQSTH